MLFESLIRMEPSHKSFIEFCLTFERRADGGLRVYSDDIPELLLSHRDCSLVMADVAPALETILSEKYSKSVKVGPLRHIREDLEDHGIITPDVMNISHKKYAADLEEA